MQGFFDEQDGNIATLLDISQCIDIMEEWTKSNKSSTGKCDCSVSKKLDKSPNKKQKTGFFCEYHKPKNPHGTKDCTAVKAIPQSTRKSCDDKDGLDRTVASSATTNVYQERSVSRNPGMVKLKTSTCKPFSLLPSKRLPRNSLQSTLPRKMAVLLCKNLTTCTRMRWKLTPQREMFMHIHQTTHHGQRARGWRSQE